VTSSEARAQLYAEGEIHRLQGELLDVGADAWTPEMWLRLMEPVVKSAFVIGYAAGVDFALRAGRKR